MRYFNKQGLIGRTIVAVRLNGKRESGRGVIHEPEIVLDNGRVIRFGVEESDFAHGVSLIYPGNPVGPLPPIRITKLSLARALLRSALEVTKDLTERTDVYLGRDGALTRAAAWEELTKKFLRQTRTRSPRRITGERL